jgi:chitinase
MTYDMHTVLDEYTNHQSAIYANPADPSPAAPVDVRNKYNTDFIMKYYRDHFNIPASKLNAGSPFYSRGWANVDPDTGKDGLFAKAKGAPVGNLDSPSFPAGQNSYDVIRELEKTPGFVKYRDAESQVPWLYNKAEGIMYTYEDEASASARCDYVLENGFGGVIVWEITLDSGISL